MIRKSLTEPTVSLSASEQKSLQECERVIERGVQTFLEVGIALREIRDARLYRDTHKTFAKYVSERWGWKRAHAYRLIRSVEVNENLSPTGDKKPTTERDYREVAKAPPEKQQQVVDAAQNKAATQGREPAAKDYREAVGELCFDSSEADSQVEYEDEDFECQQEGSVGDYVSDAPEQAISHFLDAFSACEQRLVALRALVDEELMEHEKAVLLDWLTGGEAI